MEANVCRQIFAYLKQRLLFSRLEKIYNPLPLFWTFKFSSLGLVGIYCSRRQGTIFSLPKNVENPKNPSAKAMLLRKHLRNKRVKQVLINWPQRELWLDFGETGLLLSLNQEPLLKDKFQACETHWPSLEAIEKNPQIYLKYPQITPPLRKFLTKLKNTKAKQLFYLKLIQGKLKTFFIYPTQILLWPTQTTPLAKTTSTQTAFQLWGEQQLKILFPAKTNHQNKLVKKLKKTLTKLEQEKERLEQKKSLLEQAKILQANLYQLDPKAKVAELEFTTCFNQKVKLKLDPQKSVQENMDYFFKQAAKAKKGLIILKERQRQIQAELLQVQEQTSSPAQDALPSPSRTKTSLPIKRFRSSDGFLILRGKNQKANHKLLSLASSFDYWFHVEDGPGAHVILKRDHPKQTVPQNSLEQAAALAGLASYQKNNSKAKVMGTEVKYVRKVKGLSPGQVVVDKILFTFNLALNPELEKILEEKT